MDSDNLNSSSDLANMLAIKHEPAEYAEGGSRDYSFDNSDNQARHILGSMSPNSLLNSVFSTTPPPPPETKRKSAGSLCHHTGKLSSCSASLEHYQKICELIRAGQLMAAIAAIEQNFQGLLSTHKELDLLLKANSLIEQAVILQQSSQLTSPESDDTLKKLAVHSRMLSGFSQLANQLLEFLKQESEIKESVVNR
uniref:CTLH domain-containing protein n=1 Tax=Ditylenchus dipsaci TaxID=166011 RepID=A0A915EJD9_9BILA